MIGDARLTLQNEPQRHYGLLVIDAFSGDTIPVHLLTREALDLYLDKLAGHGIPAFHISNQFLDLEPVISSLAESRSMIVRDRMDEDLTPLEVRLGKTRHAGP